MAFYQAVQDISDAQIWVKKLCRELSPRFAAVQAALDAIPNDQEMKDNSETKSLPLVTHLDMAQYRARVAEANLMVEEANAMMAQVHLDLNEEAKKFGVDDHVYVMNGPGGR